MFKRVSRLVVLCGTFIAALALAQPALGFTQTNATGTVGAYSVTDTKPSPAAVCAYKFKSADNLWQLKHIYVNDPKMKAVSGQGTEKVAWDFTVQRREIGFGGIGPWKDRYTSPKISATTDQNHNANFGNTQPGVKVTVPFQAGQDASAEYRVVIKMFWYKANGKDVLGTVTGHVDWYAAFESTSTVKMHETCSDYDD